MRNDILSHLQAQLLQLQQLEETLLQRLQDAPEGSLHISKCADKLKYYIYSEQSASSKKKRHYLNQNQSSLIQALLQKDYDKKMYTEVVTLKNRLSRFLDQYHPETLQTIYTDLSGERKQWVHPDILDNESYTAVWESVSYPPGNWDPSAPFFITRKGERVRSKTEKIIADTLYDAAIPYRYEYPLTLTDGRIWRPDFTILNKRTREEYRLEHFGMMDNLEYCNQALGKLRIYAQNGFYPGENLLLTFETRAMPFSTTEFDQLIRHYLL